MKTAARLWASAGTAAVWLAAAPAALAQCALCKTGLLASSEGQRMAHGFNRGILFLLTVPFLIVGTMTFLILTAQRRSMLASRSGDSAGRQHRETAA